ncbi:MAG: hypothetical protein AAF974_05420 [Cyanobacteria bacterium P01_E01_bin.34]
MSILRQPGGDLKQPTLVYGKIGRVFADEVARYAPKAEDSLGTTPTPNQSNLVRLSG